jgi:nucleoside-diphosphate-sugar epimerase
MKALVTGASGFSGRHLCRYLNEQGVEVSTLSAIGSADYRLNGPTDYEGMIESISGCHPDLVFHLAGLARAEDPLLLYQVNAEYALCLLRALKETGLEQVPLLLVGSAAEYGKLKASELPAGEHLQGRPETHYGISKLTQTLIGLAAAAEGRRVVIARPSNFAGPGMPEHLVLGALVRQLSEIAAGRREPVVELGNLQTARDLVDVRDGVRIFLELLLSREAYGEIVNVCSGKPVAVRLLVERMIELSGLEVKLMSKAEYYRAADMEIFCGSIEKLRGLIGYVPEFDVSRTLQSMLDSVTA